MSLPPGTQIGKYVLVRELAHGGFGYVHVGRDTELDREVAIKVLRREYSSSTQHVQRFLQEARAAARINHAGIVTVFECGQVEQIVYIAMELLAGETLQARLKREGKVPPGDAIELCRQLASALEAAHAAGIVHRDLKPPNIFLVRDSSTVGGVRVKILDFGIAKLAGAAVQTRSSVILGTPTYMSPEQCKAGARIDTRTDIYSLGVILFEMLTGNPPFVGESLDVTLKHQHAKPPRIRDTAQAVPRMLDVMVDNMLAKAPDDRPPTMAAILDELAGWRAEGYSEIATTPHLDTPRVSIDPEGHTAVLGDATVVDQEQQSVEQATTTGSITVTDVDVPVPRTATGPMLTPTPPVVLGVVDADVPTTPATPTLANQPRPPSMQRPAAAAIEADVPTTPAVPAMQFQPKPITDVAELDSAVIPTTPVMHVPPELTYPVVHRAQPGEPAMLTTGKAATLLFVVAGVVALVVGVIAAIVTK